MADRIGDEIRLSDEDIKQLSLGFKVRIGDLIISYPDHPDERLNPRDGGYE